MYSFFSAFVSDVHKIRDDMFKNFEFLGVSLKSIQWKPYFTLRRQWTCVRTFDIYCPIWVKFDIKILA